MPIEILLFDRSFEWGDGADRVAKRPAVQRLGRPDNPRVELGEWPADSGAERAHARRDGAGGAGGRAAVQRGRRPHAPSVECGDGPDRENDR